MRNSRNKLLLKYLIFIGVLTVLSLVLWNTYVFFKKFKEEERSKMEIYATAIQEMTNNPDLNDDFNLVSKIYSNVDKVPSMLTDKDDNIIAYNNLDSVKSLDKMYLEEQLAKMKFENPPIEISYYDDIPMQYVYYRNSDVLVQLTYYPVILIVILASFLFVFYLFFNSEKVSEQNRLWTGMAKETAHQIGTPLSSLMGWVAILRTENVNETYVSEIEKDINRLEIITNRFSKIGSVPKLELVNIVEICKNTFLYLESRCSKRLSFSFITSDEFIKVNCNKELIGWVIENLTKNAIDAMQGKGQVSLFVSKQKAGVVITITDSGKGISKSKFKAIFNAGYTTKKRGWGLGLSLSKRIIQDYHKGEIYVKKSGLGIGTSFEILLR